MNDLDERNDLDKRIVAARRSLGAELVAVPPLDRLLRRARRRRMSAVVAFTGAVVLFAGIAIGANRAQTPEQKVVSAATAPAAPTSALVRSLAEFADATYGRRVDASPVVTTSEFGPLAAIVFVPRGAINSTAPRLAIVYYSRHAWVVLQYLELDGRGEVVPGITSIVPVRLTGRAIPKFMVILDRDGTMVRSAVVYRSGRWLLLARR